MEEPADEDPNTLGLGSPQSELVILDHRPLQCW